jgi:hypothetical protein
VSVLDLEIFYTLALNENFLLNNFEVSPFSLHEILSLFSIQLFLVKIRQVSQSRGDGPCHMRGLPEQKLRHSRVSSSDGRSAIIGHLHKIPMRGELVAEMGVSSKKWLPSLGVISMNDPIVAGHVLIQLIRDNIQSLTCLWFL